MKSRITAGMAWVVCGALSAAFGANVYYVSPNGSHTPPFASWGTAATNIHDAVSLMVSWQSPADLCLVTNGHYRLTNTLATAALGIEIRSINGPEVTVLDGGDTFRCADLLNYQTLRGFTLTGGRHASYGGGVHANGSFSIVDRCILVSNTAPYAAAAFLVGEAKVRNSIIKENQGGGVFTHWSGDVENCLVTDNRTDATSGGAVYVNYGGNVRNTISYGNTGTAGRPNWHLGGTAAATLFQYCNTTPDIGSATCFTDAPDFRDAAAGDYRLYPGAPHIDAGTNFAWMASANDLDGVARQYGPVDIGPYELTPGALLCSFDASPRAGAEPLSVTLTAAVSGLDQTGLHYRWDLDSDGTVDAEGPDLATLTAPFDAGIWSVSLTVSNAAGEVTGRTRAAFITAAPATLYVAASGNTPTPPYSSWATAANTLQDALDAAADTCLVLVGEGVFSVTSPVVIAKAVTVRGADKTMTIIDGGATSRCVTVSHADARLEHVTLRNGRAEEGAGAHLSYGGTLYDCTLLANHATARGGGAYLLNGGLLDSCLIVSNTVGVASVSGSGGGIYNEGFGGIVTNSLLLRNSAGTEGGGYMGSGGTRLYNSLVVSNTTVFSGGGMRATGGGATHDVRNCVFLGNTAQYWGGAINNGNGAAKSFLYNCLFTGNTAGQSGGALYMHTAQLDMDGCTVTGNAAPNMGGIALSWDTHNVRNCILFGNSGSTYPNWYTTDQAQQDISYTCTTPLPTYGTNNSEADPLLRDVAAGDFTLRRESPCVNTGLNRDWMAAATDLGGRPRISMDRVDMGAFELPPPAGTLFFLR
jgi:predicted outer membrane repeat protein